MKKLYGILAIVLTMLALFGVPAAFFVEPDREFSETENRYLAQKPEFSMEGLVLGEYMQEAEKYVGDQFPFRDGWISLKSDFQRAVGCREINGVYLGEDGYLLERWLEQEFDAQKLNENVEAINSFAGKHPELETTVLLVPTAGMIYQDKLPENAPMFEQQKALKMVKEKLKGASYLDVAPLLYSHREEELYYRTDHHWTTRGAFLAYKKWCETKGISVEESDFIKETVSADFQGSLYSRVLGSHCAKDCIERYDRRYEGDCQVEYNLGKTISSSVYDAQRLEEKDQYQFFLSGNHPELTIRTSQKNGKHLLVIKDSYANAFIPFLTGDYESVHVLDLRYFNGNLEEYITENQIGECLFLYNIKNFCEDNNMSRL